MAGPGMAKRKGSFRGSAEGLSLGVIDWTPCWARPGRRRTRRSPGVVDIAVAIVPLENATDVLHRLQPAHVAVPDHPAAVDGRLGLLEEPVRDILPLHRVVAGGFREPLRVQHVSAAGVVG